jgi:hypothetical protein
MSTTIKYKLDDFAEANESILIGIISSAPDYTVCWHINNQLQINLSRCVDLKFDVIQKNKKEVLPDLFSAQENLSVQEPAYSEHHVFKYFNEQLFCDYYLIVNKGTRVNLEPQLKKVTYFLEISGADTENIEQIIFDMNAIEPIEMAYLIGKESIINKLQLLI